jgi:hypothetical protein
MRSRCQLTLLTLITFGVAWSRDWTMTSKLRVVEFGVGSLEILYIGRFNGVDPCQQALTDDSYISRVTGGGGLTYYRGASTCIVISVAFISYR